MQFTLYKGYGYPVMENVLLNLIWKLTRHRLAPSFDDIEIMNLSSVVSASLREKPLQDQYKGACSLLPNDNSRLAQGLPMISRIS